MNSDLSKVVMIAIAIIAFVGWVTPLGDSAVVEQNLAGTTNYDALDVSDGYMVDGTTVIDGTGTAKNLVVGGACTATSSSGILTAAVLDAYNCITMTATGAGQAVISLTLPATSTMTSFLTDAGDCKAFTINASALSTGTTTTLVAGTGHDIVGLDATGAGTGADVIDGAEFMNFRMCRETDTDVTTYVQEYIAAD